MPLDFALGVKLNAADYADDATSAEALVLEHVREITSWRMVDLIEVSGGSYENPGKM